MSTPVVVATHADGVLRCYHRTADGALSQTAQIMAGTDFEPTALASFVADLSTMFDWSGQSAAPTNGHAVQSPSAPVAEIEHSGTVTDTALLDVLQSHGVDGLSARQLGDLLIAPPISAAARDALRKRIERLVQSGAIERVPRTAGEHHRYRLPNTQPVDDYRKRPRASYEERDRRRAAVLDYVRAHPDSTVRDVAYEVFAHLDIDKAIGKARSLLVRHEQSGALVRTEHGDEPLTYSVAAPQSSFDLTTEQLDAE